LLAAYRSLPFGLPLAYFPDAAAGCAIVGAISPNPIGAILPPFVDEKGMMWYHAIS